MSLLRRALPILKLTLISLSSNIKCHAGLVHWSYTPCDSYSQSTSPIESITTNPSVPHLGKEMSAELVLFEVKEDIGEGSKLEFEAVLTSGNSEDTDSDENDSIVTDSNGSDDHNKNSSWLQSIFQKSGDLFPYINTMSHNNHKKPKSKSTPKTHTFSGTTDICSLSKPEHKVLPFHLGSLDFPGLPLDPSTGLNTCPLKKGEKYVIKASGEITSALRWVFPKGTVTVRGKDGLGKEFGCVVLEYKISGWAGGDDEKETLYTENVDKVDDNSSVKEVFI